MQFKPYKPRFGLAPPPAPDEPEDDGQGLPTPKTVKLAARRAAGIKEAGAVLQLLPGPGESLHALCTARMDLTDVIGHLLDHYGPCDRLTCATLGYNERNLASLLAWVDERKVGALLLLTSIFFRAHKPPLWKETQEQFRKRNQRVAAAHSHAKVVTLAFASGVKLVIEGSANLCGNGSGREQFALINHVELHGWHSAWITAMVEKHEPSAEKTEGV